MPLTEEQMAKIALKGEERKKRAILEGKLEPPTARSIVSTLFAPLFGVLWGRFYMDAAGMALLRYLEHRFGRLAARCLRPPACRICKRLADVAGNLKNFLAEERVCGYWVTLRHNVDPKTSSYIRLNRPVLLHGTPALGDAIEDLVDVLGNEEDVHRFFRPDLQAIDCVVKLTFNGKFAPVELSTVNIEPMNIPPLPLDAPLLSNAVYPEGLPPDPVQVQAILDAIEQQSKSQVKLSADGVSRLEISQDYERGNSDAHENCPAWFGTPPTAPGPACVLCRVEDECHAEAARRKSDG